MPTISLSVSVLSSLRSSTAVLPYAVNNFDPDFVLDFKNSVYKTGGSATTISSAVTHARASQATMTDSDGTLKWSPHNLLPLSNTFNSGWGKRPATSIVANNAVGPYGIANTASTLGFSSTTSQLYKLTTVSFSAGDKITLASWVRSDNITSLTLSINGRSHGANNTPFANVAVTSTWSLVKFEGTVQVDDNGLYFIFGWNSIHNVNTQIGDIEIYGAHMYRSDLGGMVNNPETGDSYVPTSDSPVYLPRTGHHVYNGSAWVNEGILHESEARTNLYPSSSDTYVTGAFAITKTSDSAVSPDGTTTADLITPTTTDARHLFQYSSSYSSGSGNETYSFYAKSNGYNIIEVAQRNQGGGTITKFDLSAVTATTTSGTEIFNSIEDVGNGWYRCSASYISSSTRPYPAIEFLDTDGSQGFAGDGTSGIYFWGHQLEAGSIPSSYVPTSGTQVTRAAETLTVPAANLPYSSTNMSIQMDGKMTYADNNINVEVEPYKWQQDGVNYLNSSLSTLTGRIGQITFNQRHSTSGFDGIAGSITGYSPNVNVPFNISARHGSMFINGAHEGTLLTADTTPTILPNLSSTDLDLGSVFMGTIGKFRMWDEDLTDTGIEEAST